MLTLDRFPGNPILIPNKKNLWEQEAVFNGSIVQGEGKYHFLYRAISASQVVDGKTLELSTIGYAQSSDRLSFRNRRQFIYPEEDWERFGCEDPRVTRFEGKYYIFYTALSSFPPVADSIKVALAITSDFTKIEEKHLMTPFNAKAMALFPERIDGKMVALLTVDTDKPPSKIAIAYFDREEQMWDVGYWKEWYKSINKHVIGILRSSYDQVEVGSSPLKTKEGWLVFYSYIKNYLSSPRVFGIEAILLDSYSPQMLIGRTSSPLLVPEEEYELYGKVSDVIFPSGAIIHNDQVGVYYGAADTICCLATCNLDDLLGELRHIEYIEIPAATGINIFTRYSDNPIIQPIPENSWESRYTFNPTAIYEGGKVHILYRAMGSDETSVIGYASSSDGVHIDERLTSPIYVPKEEFEKKVNPGYSGCEDPRITRIDSEIYMLYTAFRGIEPTRVAMTTISIDNFLEKNWNWKKSILISPPDMNDKNACIFPEKISGKFVILHRIFHSIWIDFIEDLSFEEHRWIYGRVLLQARKGNWDSEKVGIGPPPIKTEKGWLLIYHGLSEEDKKYRLGACLLDLDDPSKVRSRLKYPILEPERDYEKNGFRPGTVFSCGAVVIGHKLFVYYGGADQVVCVASTDLEKLLRFL